MYMPRNLAEVLARLTKKPAAPRRARSFIKLAYLREFFDYSLAKTPWRTSATDLIS